MANKQYQLRGVIRLYNEKNPSKGIHWHDDFEMIVVLSGSIDLQLGFEKLTLNENELMIISSGESHRIKSTSEDTEVLFVVLDMDRCFLLYPGLYESIAIANYDVGFKSLNGNKDVILSDISSIIKVFAANERPDRELVSEKIDTLLSNIITSYIPKVSMDKEASADNLNQDFNQDKVEMVYRVLKYLYENYSRKVNLQEIADREFISLYHLSHCFKEITGFCFRDWLNYIRVEHSEKLLLTTDKPLSTISEECGFSDVRYYNKHFKKWYGIVPSRFRDLFKSSYNASAQNESRNDRFDISDMFNLETVQENEQSKRPRTTTVAIELAKGDLTGRGACKDGCKDNYKDSCEGDTGGKVPSLKTVYLDLENILHKVNQEKLALIKSELGFEEVIVDLDLYNENTPLSQPTIMKFVKSFTYLKEQGWRIVFDFYSGRGFESKRIFFHNLFESAYRKDANLLKDAVIQLPITNITSDELHVIEEEMRADYSQYFDSDDFIRISEGGTKDENVFKTATSLDIILRYAPHINNLIMQNGLKAPLYYFYMLLSHMGEEVVCESENYLVTSKGDDLQVLLYNKPSLIADNASFNVKVSGLNGKYKIVTYKWMLDEVGENRVINNSEVLKYITPSERDMLNIMSYPDSFFDLQSIEGDYDDALTLEDNAVQLILFTQV